MQTLTDDLLDIMVNKLQAGASGFRGEIEIDYLVGSVATPALVQQKSSASNGDTTVTFDANVTIGNLVIARLFRRQSSSTPQMFDGSWTLLAHGGADGSGGATHGAVAIWGKVASSSSPAIGRDVAGEVMMTIYEISDGDLDAISALDTANDTSGAGGSGTLDFGDYADAGGVAIIGFAIPRGTDQRNNGFTITPTAGWTEEVSQSINGGSCVSGDDPWVWGAHAVDQASLDASVDYLGLCSGQTVTQWAGAAVLVPAAGSSLSTVTYRPSSIDIDKSRRMTAAQANVTIPLEDEAGTILTADSDIFRTNNRVRIYEWFGDRDNRTLVFTGTLDQVRESRDLRSLDLACRDNMKWLIEQNITLIAPQGADEDGNDRTTANYVYLGMSVEDILDDLLDKAGVPDALRDIMPTGLTLEEFDGSDGASYADTIIGDDRLSGLASYDMWADEVGVIHWAPALSTQDADSDTDAVPDYSYVVGDAGSDNLVSAIWLDLAHSIDEYDLRTRVKVRGSIAIAKPAWAETWHTNLFTKPVGLWYDPTQSTHVRVLDRGTKKIYNLKQSDRTKDGAGIYPIDISGDVTYPLGLSGDPADSDRFWVLEAAWRVGAGNSASVHKYDASSGAHLAEYSLPDGQWSDLKVTSAHLVLTNYGTGKIHLRSKTDGSAVSNATTTYAAVAQDNPTGVFADSTTLGLFFQGHARFLLVDESDTTTVDTTNALGVTAGKISTAGTKINGGEMDTDTDADLFACSDDLGLVWKFALTEPATDAVSTELIDTDLEDELGFLSGTADREHDAHPGDADHPFEIRRETMEIAKLFDNAAQAAEVASRRLAIVSHRRETLDIGTVGNPGLQLPDLIQATDDRTGIDALYVLDTIRSHMDTRGFFATLAVLPYAPVY